MFISVIVCTYNRASILKNCLESLAIQTCSPQMYEVIVVDNNSKDATKALVKDYQGKVVDLHYVFEATQGLSIARNRGCEEARGDYLAFMDDDAIAPPGWLENILSVISNFVPDIMGGPVFPYYLSKKPDWFKDEYEIRKYTGKSEFVTQTTITGSNYVIRKDLVQRLGGFDPKLGMIGNHIGVGEERALLDLYRRITPVENQRVYYAHECYIQHYVSPSKMTISYRIQRNFLIGKTSFLLKEKGGKGNQAHPSRGELLFFLGKAMVAYPYHFFVDLVLTVRDTGFNRRRLVEYLFIQAKKLGFLYGRFLCIFKLNQLTDISSPE